MKTKITERVNNVDDAIKTTGRPVAPEFTEVPEDLREFFKSVYNTVVIVEALNEGHVPNYDDSNELKWFPWHRKSPSGFVFYYSRYCFSSADAGSGRRFALKSEELSNHLGTKFPEVIDGLLLK